MKHGLFRTCQRALEITLNWGFEKTLEDSFDNFSNRTIDVIFILNISRAPGFTLSPPLRSKVLSKYSEVKYSSMTL